jgi:hypothetical protein
LLDEGSGVEDATADEGVEETDPYAIPEDGIDEAYVERVLEAIYEVNREALAMTLESELGGLAPFEAEELMRAIYGGEYGAHQASTLHQVAGTEALRERFRNPVGQVEVSDIRIVESSAECVLAQRTSDFSAALLEPDEPITEFVALSIKPEDVDPAGLNPTPWRVTDANIDSSDALQCP